MHKKPTPAKRRASARAQHADTGTATSRVVQREHGHCDAGAHAASSTPLIHDLKSVASFALLGAVLSGSLLGWVAAAADLRVAGALAGAVIGVMINHHKKPTQ